jgi:hypothetical protein
MNTSSKFPVKRRLDVSSDFISVSPKLRLLAKEIVDDFLSTKGGYNYCLLAYYY